MVEFAFPWSGCDRVRPSPSHPHTISPRASQPREWQTSLRVLLPCLACPTKPWLASNQREPGCLCAHPPKKWYMSQAAADDLQQGITITTDQERDGVSTNVARPAPSNAPTKHQFDPQICKTFPPKKNIGARKRCSRENQPQPTQYPEKFGQKE